MLCLSLDYQVGGSWLRASPGRKLPGPRRLASGDEALRLAEIAKMRLPRSTESKAVRRTSVSLSAHGSIGCAVFRSRAGGPRGQAGRTAKLGPRV